ncbi:hypothetical protein ACFLU6_14275, partial [Acidobacteriota bacterium]
YYDAIRHDLKVAFWNNGGWNIETLDSDGEVGTFTSLRCDGSGNPFVSYYDTTNGDLKLASWDGSAWTIEVVDAAGDVGQYSSLVLDNNDLPSIAYYDVTNRNLKFAGWDGSSWSIEDVDTSTDVGRNASMVLDGSNDPMIAYWDWLESDLRVARKPVNRWSIEIVDSLGAVGQYASLESCGGHNHFSISYYDRSNGALKHAYDVSGNWVIETADNVGDVGTHTSVVVYDHERGAMISYIDETNGALKFAQFDKGNGVWDIETLDTRGDVGQYSSLQIPSSDQLIISYYNAAHGDLKLASWDWSTWTIETVDNGSDVGMFSSVAVKNDGYPAVSYYDAVNGDLKYAGWDGGTWTIETVDTLSNVGQYSSLAMDGAGNPAVAYHDATFRDLKLATWMGSDWQIDVVDNSTVGTHASLAIDPAGIPSISYYNLNQRNLRLLKDPIGIAVFHTADAMTNVGWYSSLAIDMQSQPAISYYDMADRALNIARFDGAVWSQETVDNDSDVGGYTSLEFNPEGHPAISYYDWTRQDLKYARWNGASWRVETVDNEGDVGQYSSLAFDPMGNPAISYYDSTNGDLKLAVYPYLRLDDFSIEGDRCAFGSPPGTDGRINPGEDVDLRISAINISDFLTFTSVTAVVEPVTAGVAPSQSVLSFPDLPPGQSVAHQGGPITVTVPFWLVCGDQMQYRIRLWSSETGELPPQYFYVPVDGDPVNCVCEPPPPDLVFNSLALSSDRCSYGSPPGWDGRVNPGEAADLRISIENTSSIIDYTSVSGTVDAITPGVTPVQTSVPFPDIPAGQVVEHLGGAASFQVPLSVTCGDVLAFSLTLTTNETGPLAPDYFTLDIDGDPANCPCAPPPPPLEIDSWMLIADRCAYNGSMDRDNRVNPGEDIDLKLNVMNNSAATDYHNVNAAVEVLTPGVMPSQANLAFGDVAAGEAKPHTGSPLTLDLPLSLDCGDEIQFRITMRSDETGDLSPEIVRLPINGDPSACHCTPVDLFYESLIVEDDRCFFASPPGSDGRVNPGEDLDVRITIINGSLADDLTMVAGTVEALTPGVIPPSTVLDFGDLMAGQVADHLGDPLTLSVPSQVSCGDRLEFLLTLSSVETGALPVQYFDMLVDGDPLDCECRDLLSLSYDSTTIEEDLCAYASPPGGDGLVNPGEDVSLRLSVNNGALVTQLTQVTGSIDALTPGVILDRGQLDFGSILAGQRSVHQGNPLMMSVPDTLGCGDTLSFQLTLNSMETGELPPESFVIPVDGDPVNCHCDQTLLPSLHRGTVPALIPGWKQVFLPLTSGNDDETFPFPLTDAFDGFLNGKRYVLMD